MAAMPIEKIKYLLWALMEAICPHFQHVVAWPAGGLIWPRLTPENLDIIQELVGAMKMMMMMMMMLYQLYLLVF